MVTEVVRQAFFALLQSGLWGRSISSTDYFPLQPTQWQALLQLSISQAVEGVIYDGISTLEATLFPPKEILLKWVARVDAIERRNKWMNSIIGETSALFNQHGISCMLLKGHGVAAYYEQPLHRSSGDIDYYFPDEQSFKAANRIVYDKGIPLHKGTLYSTHYIWRKCEIEHHTQMIDIMNPWKQKYLKQLEQEEQHASIRVNLAKGSFVTPSPLLMHIQLHAHLLKHFLGFGIGLRQFCDIARTCFHHAGQIDGGRLKKIYKRLGIYTWIQVVHRVLVEDIGLDERYLPFPLDNENDATWLIQDVLTVGNFGFYDQRFNEGKQGIETRKRNHALKRVLPHWVRAAKYVPSEALWFPWQKIHSALSRKRVL